MDKAIEAFRHPNVWAVSVQLLILYCVSVALFFAVDSGNRSASASLKDGVKSGKALNQLFLFGLAAASNALAVLTFVYICRKLSTVPRLAMTGLPLILLVEKHVRAIRANPEQRRLELLLAAGVTIGIAGGMCALMRDCPFK
jgi:hypothetical protein